MKRREFSLVLAGTAFASLGGSVPAHPIEGFAATTSRDDGWSIAAGDDDRFVDTAALSKVADRLAAIRIVPELDLVVTVTAGHYQDYSPQAFKLQHGVFSDALQAVLPPR